MIVDVDNIAASANVSSAQSDRHATTLYYRATTLYCRATTHRTCIVFVRCTCTCAVRLTCTGGRTAHAQPCPRVPDSLTWHGVRVRIGREHSSPHAPRHRRTGASFAHEFSPTSVTCSAQPCVDPSALLSLHLRPYASEIAHGQLSCQQRIGIIIHISRAWSDLAA
jgi:hypothetical protein|eukprot:1832933-Prymnesium_polylepis.1